MKGNDLITKEILNNIMLKIMIMHCFVAFSQRRRISKNP